MFFLNFNWSSRTRRTHEALNLDENDPETATRTYFTGTSRNRRFRRRIPVVLVLAFATIVTLYSVHAIVVRSIPIVHQYTAWTPTDALWQLLSLTIPDSSRNDPNSSTRWAPTAISECKKNTPVYYAPCVAERTYGAAYGEELIYPDFRLREPVFSKMRSEDRKQWRSLVDGIRERAAWCSEEGWVCYRGQTGQNIIVGNATYTGNPPADSWSDQACMADGVSLAGLQVLPEGTELTSAEYEAKYPIDSLVIATSPDSWSFQHFLDRITHIMSQSQHLLRGYKGDVVTGRAAGGAVSEMWEMLGYEGHRLHHGERGLGAKAVLFSCRAPLVHPWLSLKALETFGHKQSSVPIDLRKKVVYFSRSHGGTSNGGRRVVNEGALLDAIRALLVERGQDEELVLFHEQRFGSQRQLMAWFHDNVRAVIGPHGGGLFNHRWTGTNTLVLEMMTSAWTSVMFWEEASILGQVYSNVFLPPAGGTDMTADVSAVLDILQEHLGKPDARGPAIAEMYRWRGPELQLTGSPSPA